MSDMQFNRAAASADREVVRAFGGHDDDPHDLNAEMRRLADECAAEQASVFWCWMASRVTQGGRYRGQLCSDRQWRTVTRMQTVGRVVRSDPEARGPLPLGSWRVRFDDAISGARVGDLEAVLTAEPAEAVMVAAAVEGIDPPQYGLPQLLHQQVPRALTTWYRTEWTYCYGDIDVTVTAVFDAPAPVSR